MNLKIQYLHRPIPVPDFGKYVAELHADSNSNQLFIEALYKVWCYIHACMKEMISS